MLNKDNMLEFGRYILVGGAAFLVDAGVLIAGREWLFRSLPPRLNLILATVIAFFFGLLCNYLLSQWFVFRTPEQRALGWTRSAFAKFAVIGLIGLGLTAIGMLIGVSLVGDTGFRYVLVKIVIAALVLIWNYIGRKVFVYRGK